MKGQPKLKNTGLLFELLVNQILTKQDAGKSEKAALLVKEYFSKTSELTKEWQLFSAVLNNDRGLEVKDATELIDLTCEMYNKLDKRKLNKLKYDLVKEINQNFNTNTFFKEPVKNYKQLAALAGLFKTVGKGAFSSPQNIMRSKNTLVEYLIEKPKTIENTPSKISEGVDKLTEGEKVIAFNNMLKEFNKKYKNQPRSIKNVLKEYIYTVGDEVKLLQFKNKYLTEIGNSISNYRTPLKNSTVINIKLDEVQKNIQKQKQVESFDNKDLKKLIQYNVIVEQLKSFNV